MQRIPEPELMDDEVQARAYAQADFDAPHAMFIELFAERFPEPEDGFQALDLGCGSADITLRFAARYPRCRIDGIDGAAAMLNHGREAIEHTGMQRRVRLIQRHLPATDLPNGRYDVVISNSLLHHLADPLDMWRTIQRCAAPGASVFVMDLLRPPDRQTAVALAEQYAGNEPEVLRRDFFNSLCAAYRPDEIQRQLDGTALGGLTIEVVSDRHLIVYGIPD